LCFISAFVNEYLRRTIALMHGTRPLEQSRCPKSVESRLGDKCHIRPFLWVSWWLVKTSVQNISPAWLRQALESGCTSAPLDIVAPESLLLIH
jgi:hypothetical protein